MSETEKISISISNEKKIDENIESTYIKISFDQVFPIIILNDFRIPMSFNNFFCEFVSELRKTFLAGKIWCEKDSLIFNNFHCHFTTLKYINNSKCVVLFLMDINSLNRKHFINYMEILEWKMKNKSSHFNLISVFTENAKSNFQKVKEKLPINISQFVDSEIFNNGLELDSKADLKHMVMYTVSNILPLIVSHIYPPHQLASMNIEEFYQMKNATEEINKTYSEKSMHLWTCSDLADWLVVKSYPTSLVEDLENKNINGFVIQNSTSEDLRDYLKISSPILRRKLIDDVYDYLKENDIKSNNWHFQFRKSFVKSKQILVINDISEKFETEKIFNCLKSIQNFNFKFDHTENTDETDKQFGKVGKDFELAKSKIIIIFANFKTVTKNGEMFRIDIENKILFSIWLKKPIIFLFSDINLMRLNQELKILIGDQPVLDIRSNSPDSIGQSLIGLFDILNNQSNIMFSKFNIQTISSFDEQKQISHSPGFYLKRKVILHFHTECRKKIDIMKDILEKNDFIVTAISVDQIYSEFGHYFENSRQIREELLINSNIIISCLSESYIQDMQTKIDLKLLCQLLRKNLVVVLIQHLRSLKLLPKIDKMLFPRCPSSIKPKIKKNLIIPKIDLSESNEFQTMISTDLLVELRKYL